MHVGDDTIGLFAIFQLRLYLCYFLKVALLIALFNMILTSFLLPLPYLRLNSCNYLFKVTDFTSSRIRKSNLYTIPSFPPPPTAASRLVRVDVAERERGGRRLHTVTRISVRAAPLPPTEEETVLRSVHRVQEVQGERLPHRRFSIPSPSETHPCPVALETPLPRILVDHSKAVLSPSVCGVEST